MRRNVLRPVWLGALFIGGMTILRALVVIPIAMAHGQPIEAEEALRLAVIGVCGGAAAGAIYAFIGRPLRRVPHYGAILAGIVTVASYLAIVLYLVSHVSPRRRVLTHQTFVQIRLRGMHADFWNAPR